MVSFPLTKTSKNETPPHTAELRWKAILSAWASANIFPGGAQSQHFAYLSSCWQASMQRKWTYTKNKMFNAAETVACSAFLVRKLYSEQIFVLVSMDFLRLS